MFADQVIEHYSNSWEKTEAIFQEDISAYCISDAAKQACFDALRCHGFGLYRFSVLTLLPSIEMEFRKAFELEPGKQAASLQELRKLILEAPAGLTLSHVAPLDLFRVLDEHLYESVKTEEALIRFQNDPIPNRHAAIHGLVEYESELHSLNTIILADYVFFLISQLTKHFGHQGDDGASGEDVN